MGSRKHLWVTVCAVCYRASCWQGVFFCEQYRSAATLDVPVAELRRKKLEHPSWWRGAYEGDRPQKGVTYAP